MTALISPFAPGFTDEAAGDLAAVLRILGDPVRLRILSLLKASGSMTVLELTAALPITQPTVSSHLRILREAGLITSRKEGRFLFSSLDRNGMRRVAQLIHPGGAW